MSETSFLIIVGICILIAPAVIGVACMASIDLATQRLQMESVAAHKAEQRSSLATRKAAFPGIFLFCATFYGYALYHAFSL